MSGPLLVASLLLVGAGLAKFVRPHDTARAFRRAGLPVGRGPHVVRAGAGVETVVGIAGMTIGGPVAPLAVAASYACFAGFLVLALGRGWSLSSCGCFGEPDTRPTPLHVALDAVLAVGATAAVVDGRSPLSLALSRPIWGAGLFTLAVITAGLAYLVLARLPLLKVVPS